MPSLTPAEAARLSRWYSTICDDYKVAAARARDRVDRTHLLVLAAKADGRAHFYRICAKTPTFTLED